MESQPPRPRPGRPPRRFGDGIDTRQALIRCGTEILTEKGFAATGIDEVLKRVGVPKGSFYHYFESKEAFGDAVIDNYAAYFMRKLTRFLGNEQRPPLDRLADFVTDAARGMARHDFQRGCLIGNLGQEMGLLPEAFRAKLEAVFQSWQRCLVLCLETARERGELVGEVDCARLAAFFWIGWEGAVLRAKLVRQTAPLYLFAEGYFAGLPRRGS